MWSRSESAHAQHWWSRGRYEEAGFEPGKFEAALCSSGLHKYPLQPCYPEEAVLGTERCGAENSLSIPNCVDEYCAGSGERPPIDLLAKKRKKIFQFCKEFTCLTKLRNSLAQRRQSERMEGADSSRNGRRDGMVTNPGGGHAV